MSLWSKMFGRKDDTTDTGECPHCGATVPMPKKQRPAHFGIQRIIH